MPTRPATRRQPGPARFRCITRPSRRKRPILKAGLLALLAAILVTDLGVSAARAETATTGSDALLILAQQSGDRPGRPPQEAVDACADKSSGAACSFSDPDGKSMSGTCSSPDSNAPLACTPSDMPKKG